MDLIIVSAINLPVREPMPVCVPNFEPGLSHAHEHGLNQNGLHGKISQSTKFVTNRGVSPSKITFLYLPAASMKSPEGSKADRSRRNSGEQRGAPLLKK